MEFFKSFICYQRPLSNVVMALQAYQCVSRAMIVLKVETEVEIRRERAAKHSSGEHGTIPRNNNTKDNMSLFNKI